VRAAPSRDSYRSFSLPLDPDTAKELASFTENNLCNNKACSKNPGDDGRLRLDSSLMALRGSFALPTERRAEVSRRAADLSSTSSLA
jgi:hypothetical protein